MIVKAGLKLLTLIKGNRFLRFCLIGLFCALQNILILYLFSTILEIHYIISLIIQMVLVNSIGFYLNRRYTFLSNQGNFWHELWKYHTVMLSSFVSVSFIMYLLVEVFHLWYLHAFIVITIGMTIYNFLIHRRWTFK
jgi:putative flippase GtrA